MVGVDSLVRAGSIERSGAGSGVMVRGRQPIAQEVRAFRLDHCVLGILFAGIPVHWNSLPAGGFGNFGHGLSQPLPSPEAWQTRRRNSPIAQ